MSHLAIDPGKHTGWSVIGDDGQLLACGLGEPPLDAGVPRVWIERPQIYRGRAMKGDPNDLITLAIQVGRYAERFASRGCQVDTVLPHDWKGSIDPDVCCRRIHAALTECEKVVLERAILPLARTPVYADLTGGRRHNVIDAVGIGKWAIRRGRAGVFSVSSA